MFSYFTKLRTNSKAVLCKVKAGKLPSQAGVRFMNELPENINSTLNEKYLKPASKFPWCRHLVILLNSLS